MRHLYRLFAICRVFCVYTPKGVAIQMEYKDARDLSTTESRPETLKEETQHVFGDADVHRLIVEASRHWQARTTAGSDSKN